MLLALKTVRAKHVPGDTGKSAAAMSAQQTAPWVITQRVLHHSAPLACKQRAEVASAKPPLQARRSPSARAALII